MQKWQSALLGVVQGVTEFLPVSSTAHLHLVQRAMGWPQSNLVFDTSLHLGTLLATLAWMVQEERQQPLLHFPLVARLAVATLPAGLAGLFLERWIERHLRSPELTQAMIFLGGALLWLAEARAREDRSLEQLSWPATLAIGFAQMLALVPGFSRSGATITAARWVGLTRPDALRFSFLLGVPVIGASGLFKLRSLLRQEQREALAGVLLSGGLTAALSGLGVLLWLMEYVRHHSLKSVALYRMCLALGLALPKIMRPSR